MSRNIRTDQLPKGEIIPPIYDFMFTAIFNKEENLIITENFLSLYLQIPLSEIKGKLKIKPRNLELENKYVASKQVDLLLELENKRINIEVSTSVSIGIVNRNVVFACNTHATSYHYGDSKYKNIGDTIQINLVYDEDYIVGEKFRESYYLRNEKGKELTKKLRIDYVNIAKLEETCYTSSIDEIEDFCRTLIAHKEEEFKKLIGDLKMEKEAKEKLEREVMKYSQDEGVIDQYTDFRAKHEWERETIIQDRVDEAVEKAVEEAVEKAVEEAISRTKEETNKEIEQKVKEASKRALEQGKREEREEIARNFKKAGVDILIIESSTGLSKEEIESL